MKKTMKQGRIKRGDNGRKKKKNKMERTKERAERCKEKKKVSRRSRGRYR